MPKGTGTFGSKSTQIGGVAGRLAADAVVERAMPSRPTSSRQAPDVVLDHGTGTFHVVDAPVPLSWAELASKAQRWDGSAS